MAQEGVQRKFGKKTLWAGLAIGLLLSAVTVIASGFMIETTNKDAFCVRCHVMTPFRTAWTESVHGGQNPQGFTAQCVDCHLPHGNFIDYFVTKAVTGTGDVVQNFIIDPVEFDWGANAEARRTLFTFDSACRHCHNNLTPKGLTSGGFIAHRAYLQKATVKKCVDCHPHVGHKDMIEKADVYFKKNV